MSRSEYFDQDKIEQKPRYDDVENQVDEDEEETTKVEEELDDSEAK